MGATLPTLRRDAFESRLLGCSPVELNAECTERLWIHYQELVRWNPTVSLVGPGTADEIVERHYGESLAAIPLLEPEWRTAVDVGSGAGFPGLVLATAVAALEVTLVESRARKCAFLETVIRKAALPSHCLGARVGSTPPEGLPVEIDLMTSRGVNLSVSALEALSTRWTRCAGALLWIGAQTPELPKGWVEADRIELPGSHTRSILKARIGPS